jgi:hypothetical protein
MKKRSEKAEDEKSEDKKTDDREGKKLSGDEPAAEKQEREQLAARSQNELIDMIGLTWVSQRFHLAT